MRNQKIRNLKPLFPQALGKFSVVPMGFRFENFTVTESLQISLEYLKQLIVRNSLRSTSRDLVNLPLDNDNELSSPRM